MVHRLRRLAALFLIGVILSAVSAVPVLAESGTQAPSEAIAAVAAKAKPSVVGILTTMKASRSTDRGRAAGTGFVYKPGVIITNAHVVEGAAEVKILYSDKTVETVLPDNIFADATSDVAVVKVTKNDLAPLPFADSDLVAIGQTVVAIGNPLGFRLGNSVTAGILSGTGRALGSGYPFLQMDAPINPGNSGGPLLDSAGRLIGVNTAIQSPSGASAGIGFAVPVDTVNRVVPQLITRGTVVRPDLGFLPLSDPYARALEAPKGVVVGRVERGSAAARAGLQGLHQQGRRWALGDVVVGVNGKAVATLDQLLDAVEVEPLGSTVTLDVLRDRKRIQLRLVLEAARY